MRVIKNIYFSFYLSFLLVLTVVQNLLHYTYIVVIPQQY